MRFAEIHVCQICKVLKKYNETKIMIEKTHLIAVNVCFMDNKVFESEFEFE